MQKLTVLKCGLTLSSVLTLSACTTMPTTVVPTATTKPTPVTSASCKITNEKEIADLFVRWNASLATGDINKVVSNYAPQSVLLPTLSNKPRYTIAQKADYFEHFLQNKPQGVINERMIQIGCNTAVDVGLYTFNFAKTGQSVKARYTYTYAWDGRQWLITSHHSSLMPEKDITVH